MGIFDGLFGTNKPRKSRRQTIRQNQEQGRMGERRFEFWASTLGYDVERTGKGSDYLISKRDPLTGRKRSRLVDVKTGNADLSPLQKKTRAAHRGRYDVVSGDSIFDGFGSMSDSAAKKPRRRKGAARKKATRHKSVWDI